MRVYAAHSRAFIVGAERETLKSVRRANPTQPEVSFTFQMDFQESNLARLLLAAGLPSQVHSRLGSGSSSSPCTPAMQRAHLSQVYTNIWHHPRPLFWKRFILGCSVFFFTCPLCCTLFCLRLLHIIVTNDPCVHPVFSQNANLRSSRDAPHSSSMSDMAISPLSPFCPLFSTDDVFWDPVETPPKVSNNCWVRLGLMTDGCLILFDFFLAATKWGSCCNCHVG